MELIYKNRGLKLIFSGTLKGCNLLFYQLSFKSFHWVGTDDLYRPSLLRSRTSLVDKSRVGTPVGSLCVGAVNRDSGNGNPSADVRAESRIKNSSPHHSK